MRGVYVAVIIWICTCCNSALGQRFISINDEYPIARANCIYQDDYGFLWFGTRDGLVKYDGYSATYYRKVPGDSTSLPGPEVFAVLQDSDTTLLVGLHLHGLVRLDRNSGHCTPVRLGIDSDVLNVNCLIRDNNDDIWVGTNNGVFVLKARTDSGTRQNWGAIPVFQNKEVFRILQDASGDTWIGTDEGIYTRGEDNAFFRPGSTTESEITLPIFDIVEDRNNTLWISVLSGPQRLYAWNKEAGVFEADSRFKRTGEYELTFDHNNNMWVSSQGQGVYKFGEGTETYYSPDKYWLHGLRALFTRAIENDKYNNIWVSGGGIYQFSGANKNFHSIEGDGFQVISVYADDDYIWFCSREPQRWSRATGTSTPFLGGFEFSELVNPALDPGLKRIYRFEEYGNSLVMTSIRNVYKLDMNTGRITEFPTALEGAFRDFIIDHRGMIMLPGIQGMPAEMNIETGKYELKKELEQISTPVTVAKSRNGVQWWGNQDDGLFRYDPADGSIEQFIPDPSRPGKSISSFHVNDILCHSSGSVWVATKFGLNLVNPESRVVEQIAFDPNEINMHIASITEDNNGALWLGTQNGLVYYDHETDSVRSYKVHDGLINTIYTPRACYKDHNGWLYFGGDKGVDYFNPDEIGINSIPPDVYIKSIRVNNSPYPIQGAGECMRSISLDYKENSIEVEIIGLHLVSPEANICAYRLDELSENWIELGKHRKITLANLPPGNYILEGRCSNADGFWSDGKQLLEIEILAPFWHSAWFAILLVTFSLGIIYAIYRVRIAQIKESARLKQEFTRSIAEMEMKALRAQMNPHFLFNSLSSVSLLIDKRKNTEAKRYLTKYSQLIRQILNNSRRKFIRLEEEIETLGLYLDLEQMRFKNFSYVIDVDENLEIDFLEVPPMLLQPYVENALWHGLMNKQDGARKLRIELTRESGFARIVIEDNGIGRKQAEMLKSRRRPKGESLGLKISDERLHLLKEVYGIAVTVDVIDLTEPYGTRVVILLPIL